MDQPSENEAAKKQRWDRVGAPVPRVTSSAYARDSVISHETMRCRAGAVPERSRLLSGREDERCCRAPRPHRSAATMVPLSGRALCELCRRLCTVLTQVEDC